MPDAHIRARLWYKLATLSNLEEALDKLALLTSKDPTAKSLYGDFRHASGDIIQPLDARLRMIEVRKKPT